MAWMRPPDLALPATVSARDWGMAGRQTPLGEPLVGNKAIEDAAIAYVIEFERSAGRQPRDMRYRGAPADIESSGRTIEVKAAARSMRSAGFLLLEPGQVEEAQRNGEFYLYIVENVAQGDFRAFELRIVSGERLRRLVARAKERRYFEVPIPVSEYDALPPETTPHARPAVPPSPAFGLADIDAALAGLPDAFTHLVAYEQRLGYKSWKIPRQGRPMNWLQWNDGDIALRIRFPNTAGEPRTWKLFARFGNDFSPSGPWERPQPYERRRAQWMPAGPDVWGCSYEALADSLARGVELAAVLRRDLEQSYRYSVSQYGEP